MAKAFYTQDEAKAALSTDDDGLKELVHEGKLTEYRDGASLMYKGSQVEELASEGDAVALGDSAAPLSLADSDRSLSGQSAGPISLDDSSGGSLGGSVGGSVAGGSRAPGSSGAPLVAGDDTGAFALSDSMDGGSLGGTAAGASQSGITIFEDDDSDPSAQTNLGGTDTGERVDLEGIGSGSGLLDLTQEADDTSFGAETFDEIMPEGSVAGGSVAGLTTSGDAAIDIDAAPAGTRQVATVAAYEPADPSAPIFGGLAAGAAFVLLLGLLALLLSVRGGDPGFLSFLLGPEGVNTGALLGVALGLPILGAIIGLVGGKMGSA
jgi:hypothetical protein